MLFETDPAHLSTGRVVPRPEPSSSVKFQSSLEEHMYCGSRLPQWVRHYLLEADDFFKTNHMHSVSGVWKTTVYSDHKGQILLSLCDDGTDICI